MIKGKIFILLCCFWLTSSSIASTQWHSLAPGIDYQSLEGHVLTPWSKIHAFRIKLNKNHLSLVTAQELSLKLASAEDYARYTKALLVINGGFFDKNYHSLGLRINNAQQKNPLKRISWWGIFYIKNHKAYLTNLSHFKQNTSIDFAIQAGPRLLINNKIPSLKPGLDERSALGITSEGDVIILVTENQPLTTTELAKIMKAPPLDCKNALNLDGGSSTQLYAHINSFLLTVRGLSPISDAITVVAEN